MINELRFGPSDVNLIVVHLYAYSSATTRLYISHERQLLSERPLIVLLVS